MQPQGRSQANSALSNDSKPIAQFGLSEQVSAAIFLHSSKMLVAAMALKWIRCYDLRMPSGSNTTAAAVMNGRNISCLTADPFDAHCFSSVGEDGFVRMWDLRHPSEPILTFSYEDGIAKSVDNRLARAASKISLTPSISSGPSSGSIVSMVYSTKRRGYLATLDRDANYLSAWNIFEVGDSSQNLASPTPGTALMLHNASPQEEQPALPTLYYERRS